MHDCFKPLPELLAEYDRALAYTEDLWRDLDPDEVDAIRAAVPVLTRLTQGA